MNDRIGDRLYDTKRSQKSIGDAWTIATEELPDGWQIIEVSYLYGPEQHRQCWYAAAGRTDRIDADFIDAEDVTPVRALLRLARRLSDHKHQTGPPSQPYLPPAPPRAADRESPYRSPDAGTVASVVS
jgi:hypothetical protein